MVCFKEKKTQMNVRAGLYHHCASLIVKFHIMEMVKRRERRMFNECW